MESVADLNISGSLLPPTPDLTEAQQTFKWYTQPHKLLLDCDNKLGSAFTLNLNLLGTHVFFSNPATVAQILKADPVLTYETNDKEFMTPLLGENSLFLLHGQKHLDRRRLLSPPFHANKIQKHGATIQELTLQACKEWPLGKPISLLDHMFELSLRIIFNVVFGLDHMKNATEIKALIRAVLKINRAGAIFLEPSDNNTAVGELQQEFYFKKMQLDNLLLDLIEEKRHSPASLGSDILSLLVRSQDENGQYLSSAEIRDQLMTMLVAGHETTATAIAWALYWINANPKVKEKLESTCTSGDTIEEITNNAYLHAACQETLRIMPIIAIISRTLKVPVKCENYILPKGVHIAIPIFLLHRNENIYPDAALFKPERFLEKKYSFYEYLPFGGGARICIGMGLALYQMKIVLATLLSYFDMDLLSKEEPKIIRKGVVIAPAEGVMVRLSQKIKENSYC